MPDPGLFEDPRRGRIFNEQGNAQLTGVSDAPSRRVALDDDDLVVGGAQAGQDACADLAQADEDDVVDDLRCGWMVRRAGAEGFGGVHGRGDHQRQDGQPHEASDELEYPPRGDSSSPVAGSPMVKMSKSGR